MRAPAPAPPLCRPTLPPKSRDSPPAAPRLTGARACSAAAALILGYEEERWPAIEKEWADWDDLEEHEQEAAGNLGLDEDTWPPKQDLFASEWVQLNAEQQVRAAPRSPRVERLRRARPI